MNRLAAILCSILLISTIFHAQSQTRILINEILVLNESNIPDERGELSGWIEIYNPGPDSINSGGMYISNDFNNPTLWQIPETNPELTTIPPDSYLLLWHDGQPEQGALHLNFSLDGDGGQLALYSKDQSLMDSLSYGSQYIDLAYGRPQNKQESFTFLRPATPGQSNPNNMKFFDWVLYRTTRTDKLMWGIPMIALLLLTGLFLTIATRGLQFTHFWRSIKLIFAKESRSEKGEGDISPFAALMTALAATVGNGNIAGVATAIAIGGPGAPVFMWIAGLFGMATKYAEGFLGVHYREIAPNGTMAGGPMYYVKNGLKNKKIGKEYGAIQLHDRGAGQ
jgi:hypothetical protein